jgi:sensor c-di-GMP phosphodiesterase-like protein
MLKRAFTPVAQATPIDGGHLLAPRRKLLVAIAIGVVLAGPPVVALNHWLDRLVEHQAREQLEQSALRTMAAAEAGLARAEAILDELAGRGIESCRAAHIEALRQATFDTTPVKELSVVAADGRTLCSDVGGPGEMRNVIGSEPIANGSRKLLEVVLLGDRPGRWVRIRRPGAGAAPGLAALIPADLFLPAASTPDDPRMISARMETINGTLVAEADPQHAAAPDHERLSARRSSSRYGLNLTMSASRAALKTRQEDFRNLAAAASGFIAILVLALLILLPRRDRDNPIAEIERALKAGQFVPYYQPIVDIRSGRLRGAEVLVRWRKPDGSIVSPAAFIPLAESSGLIIELTRALMRRACREMAATLGQRPHLRLGFNLTAQHFADESIVDDVSKIFKKSPLRLSQLVLEVTERQPLENLTETRRVVAALQGLGVRIAIDDVGTGHSGLSYMLKLGVDIIKIDKMFVDSIGTERHSHTIIETLIDLAQNMRMEVVAEGVESFEQVVQLRDLGIRAAQGYVFAPPLPGSLFKQLVDAIDPLKQADEAASEGAAA